MEARVVTPKGFSISLATEWIENPTNRTFDKQDCEIKAFERLAIRIKKKFPCLPLGLLLDGYYPRDPVFSICKHKQWRYIITLKNKSLKSVHEQLISDIENAKWKTLYDIKKTRPDADCIHSNGFYFFDIYIHRTMTLILFEKDQATVVWAGSHEDYDKTFKDNKVTIEKWLRYKKLI